MSYALPFLLRFISCFLRYYWLLIIEEKMFLSHCCLSSIPFLRFSKIDIFLLLSIILQKEMKVRFSIWYFCELSIERYFWMDEELFFAEIDGFKFWNGRLLWHRTEDWGSIIEASPFGISELWCIMRLSVNCLFRIISLKEGDWVQTGIIFGPSKHPLNFPRVVRGRAIHSNQRIKGIRWLV